MKIFLLLVYTLLTSSIFAQEQDTCYCYIQKKHFPLSSLIYENKADTIVKIYHKNLGLVDCSLLNMASFENANRTDTINLEKSLDKVLDENDHLVKPGKFMPLRLKDYGKASDIILFEKRIDLWEIKLQTKWRSGQDIMKTGIRSLMNFIFMKTNPANLSFYFPIFYFGKNH